MTRIRHVFPSPRLGRPDLEGLALCASDPDRW